VESQLVRQVLRSLDVLEALACRGEASLAELTAATGTPRASVHRLLVALVERGYVEHAASTYRIGPAVRRLAGRSVESSLVRLSGPALVDLKAKTGETVNLAVLDGARIVYAATLDGSHQPRMSATLGADVEPHATAVGKAVLSGLSAERRRAILPEAPYPRYTDRTITAPDVLQRELDRAAENGFAAEIEESNLGATCIAVPLLGADGEAIGGISVSGVSSRLPIETHVDLAGQLRAWAHRIEDNLAAQDANPTVEAK